MKILFRKEYSQIVSKNLKIKIYKTIILPVVLYGCEAWSLTLREECRLRVFENPGRLEICRSEVQIPVQVLGFK